MRDHLDLVLDALELGFASLVQPSAPARLTAAMRHAVFGGGKRLRPQLVMEVAAAHGCAGSPGAAGAAAALELLHCASLVHDDLPCFDDADRRRGRPTVHCDFDEPTAVLTGDALIVMAFELAAASLGDAPHCAAVIGVLGRAAGANGGLAAGQAAESSRDVAWQDVHRAKTGSLFEAAVELGAIVGGAPPAPWVPVGAALGAAYQLADDLLDVVSDSRTADKPTGQDRRHARPNGAAALGIGTAFETVKEQLASAVAAVPACAGADQVRAWIMRVAASLYAAHGGPKLRQKLAAELDAAAPHRSEDREVHQ